MVRYFIFLLITTLGSVSAFSQAETSEKSRKERRIEKRQRSGRKKDTSKMNGQPDTRLATCHASIYINQYYPYCGGATPSHEDMNNYSACVATEFLLVNLGTGEQSTVVTNATGFLELDLPPGDYGLKEMYKNCTFEEFLEKNPILDNDYYQGGTEDCYREWWAAYLGKFSISAQDTATVKHQMTISSSCYVGKNPCILYRGPYPP